MSMSIAEAINVLGGFCGKRDLSELSQNALQNQYGFSQADVYVLFGGSILAGGEVMAEAIREKIARKYIIVGGEGHTTESLRQRMHAKYPDFITEGLSEAQIFSDFLQREYGYKVDYLECKSTNCGNNITYLLELLQEKNISFKSIILSQDATMQYRMAVTLRKYIPEGTTIINYATYQAKVISKENQLMFEKEIWGMWDMNRYITLLMGEVPRLTDDENGYGPLGRDFIVHVDIPTDVKEAFAILQNQYKDGVRVA
ncbi:MAG: ElyC/SanA/YdcF family protein, partial [bacterium]|nr:ElyC/SanA/YdcF family protein [bacterium]